MNLRNCRPNDAVAEAQALLCSATISIQGLWRKLGCSKRQPIQCFPEVAIPDTRLVSPHSLSTMMGLPETIQAQVLEFAGNAAASSLSLASQDLHECMWQSREVWQARLASTGAGNVQLDSSCPAADLVDQYRWRSSGLDTLCRQGAQSHSTGDGVRVLENARRAVRAITKEDAPFLDLISMNLADLIRWYDYTDASAHGAAAALVHDIQQRSSLFKWQQIRDLSSAFDSASSLREMLLVDEAELAAKVEDDLNAYSCLELLNRITDFPNECDDIPEYGNGCDEEACDRVMELLRSLPEGL